MSDSLKGFLLEQIHSKIDPYFTSKQRAQMSSTQSMDKKMYVNDIRCSILEYTSLFPSAVYFEEKKVDESKVPLRMRNKFKQTNKMYQYEVVDIKELETVLGNDWDHIFHGTAVGFVLPPIVFRLNKHTRNSYTTALSHELEKMFLVRQSKITTFTTMSVSFHRASLSLWGPLNDETLDHDECDWKSTKLSLQSNNVKIAKKRLQHHRTK